MKKIIFLLVIFINTIGYSSQYLDKLVGEWVDKYDYVLIITKKKTEYYISAYHTEYDNNDKGRDIPIFKNKKIKLLKDKYIDIFSDGNLYFLNEKTGKLNVIDKNTNKLILDENEPYILSKIENQ